MLTHAISLEGIMTYRVVCAWCKKNLGKKEAPSLSDQTIKDPITHTICAECLEKVLDGIPSSPAKLKSNFRTLHFWENYLTPSA